MPTLQFKGKPLVQNHHLVVPFSELEPMKSRGLSKSPSLHDNLIIEGDNLKALKALLPTYHGKVKCVYIDPPYNTGNEGWVYNDRVNSPMMRDWLGKTVDRDDLTRDDKWCCMMLPRLKLLKEFLDPNLGVILVSIDDNELHNLRLLLNEVFGDQNLIATLVWEKGRKNDAKFVSIGHEYILIYAASVDSLKAHGVWREAKPGAKEIQKEYERLRKLHGSKNALVEAGLREFYKKLPKGDPAKKHSRYGNVDDRGVWRDDNTSWPGGGGPTYDVIHPKTKQSLPFVKPI
jgi:adenine-specific DNA-methyltransferase